MSLLNYFGYRSDNYGRYVYHIPISSDENEKRQNGVAEFVQFFNYLKDARGDSLKDLKRFIRVKLFMKIWTFIFNLNLESWWTF